jgi:hypothetical protein
VDPAVVVEQVADRLVAEQFEHEVVFVCEEFQDGLQELELFAD